MTSKKKPPALRLLGADGDPVTPGTVSDPVAYEQGKADGKIGEVAAGAGAESPAEAGGDVQSPVPVEPRVVVTQDGPLTLRTKVEFDKVLGLGGPHAGNFLKGVDAVIGSCQGFTVRLIELMIVGAQKGEGAVASQIINDALRDMREVRGVLESIIARMIAGKAPTPQLVVAQPGDVPPAAPAKP